VAAFEASPRVNQFSSKYDAYLKQPAVFTAEEKRGLALYEGKAQCAACHPSNGASALFTDYTYDNIGVPANPANPALQSSPSFADIGLGGFLIDPTRDGAQKVPTLRNLDKRGTPGGAKAFMHNGVFKSLEEVVHFYNTRDVLPSCAAVSTPVFGVNCWPAPEVPRNVNVDELGNLGLTPARSAQSSRTCAPCPTDSPARASQATDPFEQDEGSRARSGALVASACRSGALRRSAARRFDAYVGGPAAIVPS
jgi:cytochrome c peroxidase